MAIIADAVESLKCSIREALSPDQIKAACRESRHRWRDRKLTPVLTVWLFALQILHRNTACSHVARLLPEGQVSDSAYCQARSRIPLGVFVGLFERLARRLQGPDRPTGWHGRRVLHVDGTSCSMPDTAELDTAFGHPSGQNPGCSFPTMHVLGLVEAGTGLLVGLVSNPLHTHDAKAVLQVHRHLRPGDILIADRGFSSFAQLALLVRRGVDGLFRQHQRRKTDLRRGRALGILDRLVSMPKPRERPAWMDRADFDRLPEELTVRVTKFRVEAPGYRTQAITLVTTLVDEEIYPKEELAERYLERWEIEVNFRHIKQTLGMDILKCKTVDGVFKELYMFGMVYNLVRVNMIEAASRQGVPPDRISFMDVLRWLVDRRPREAMPTFVVNRKRPDRHRPRVVKRRPKQYPRMMQRHVAQIQAARGVRP